MRPRRLRPSRRCDYIDSYSLAKRVATSIKTIDLRYDSYVLSSSAVKSTGIRYVEDLRNFVRNGGVTRMDPHLSPSQFDKYVLKLAYPADAVTPKQMDALMGVVNYGKDHGVVVLLVPIKG